MGTGSGGGITPSYVYISGAKTGVLSAYSVQQAQVSPVAVPAVPAGAVAVAATPNARFLYVATADGKILPGTIGPNGIWQPASTRAMADTGVSALLTDSTGQHLFAVSKTPASVRLFAIAATGALTPAGSAVPLASGSATGLAVSPDGRLLFLALGSGGVQVFRVNRNATRLTDAFHVLPVTAQNSDTSLAVSANGQTLYAAESGAGIRAFKVAPEGSLAEIGGSPFTSTAGTPTALAAAPGAVYVAYGASGVIAGYRADPGTGRLTAVSQARAAVDPSPQALSVLESGATLVVTSSGASHPAIAFRLAAGQPGNLNAGSMAAR
jgi:6-phosphogluconolactonase (cycloisomerase 2 family)